MKRWTFLLLSVSLLAGCSDPVAYTSTTTITLVRGQQCGVPFDPFFQRAHLPAGVNVTSSATRTVFSVSTEAQPGSTRLSTSYALDVISPVLGRPVQTAQDDCQVTSVNI